MLSLFFCMISFDLRRFGIPEANLHIKLISLMTNEMIYHVISVCSEIKLVGGGALKFSSLEIYGISNKCLPSNTLSIFLFILVGKTYRVKR